MSHKPEAEYIANTHNTARFFTEHRQVASILLIAVALWGWYGYRHMPKRKDPQIPVRVAVASTQWPGASAEEVEQLVSRPVEQTMAQNPFIKAPTPADFGIRSLSFPGLSLVYVQLDDSVNLTFFGFVIASYSVGQAVSSPFFGYWNQKTKGTRR